jgi:alpha-L-fucosidase 2
MTGSSNPITGGHIGWSRSWAAALMTRYNDSEGFYEHYTKLITDLTFMTLLDVYPLGHREQPVCFQIDGNFGGVAAVNEALVRCVDGKIAILPALPRQWDEGRLWGIKTPGGHRLDFSWSGGRLVRLTVTIGYEGKALFIIDGKEKNVSGQPGESIKVRG